ncbi:hypothetical protein FF38_03961 [Lucilia cuprina]|uniref:Uncharacterized protein n=1 Tax=Lucilia cuprina TaxID=7375 RepID=A0A0L0CDP6_LUCCU|nr:hypothetical protein FF38_03961 [Lucilia cuprina]
MILSRLAYFKNIVDRDVDFKNKPFDKNEAIYSSDTPNPIPSAVIMRLTLFLKHNVQQNSIICIENSFCRSLMGLSKSDLTTSPHKSTNIKKLNYGPCITYIVINPILAKGNVLVLLTLMFIHLNKSNARKSTFNTKTKVGEFSKVKVLPLSIVKCNHNSFALYRIKTNDFVTLKYQRVDYFNASNYRYSC